MAARQVEPGGGLVEQHQPGPVCQRDQQPQPRALSLGQLVHPSLGIQAEPTHELRHPAIVPGGVVPAQHAEQRPHAREVQGHVVGHVSEAAPHPDRVDPRVGPEHAHRARVGPHQPGEQLEQRALARAIRSHPADHVAGPHGPLRDVEGEVPTPHGDAGEGDEDVGVHESSEVGRARCWSMTARMSDGGSPSERASLTAAARVWRARAWAACSAAGATPSATNVPRPCRRTIRPSLSSSASPVLRAEHQETTVHR